MNNFPAMTEEQRQELIRHNRAKLNAITPQFLKESTPGVKKHLQSEIDSSKIALAALTAELFAYSYLYAAYETCDGFAGWSHKFSLEHPPEWMLETGKVKNLRKLYTAPPAPVLRVPDGWKLVPVEPTKEMWDAYDDAPDDIDSEWHAMLMAAPEASNEQ